MVLSDITGESGIFIDGDWIESKDQNPNGDVRLIQLADIGAGDFKNKSERHITSTTAKKLNCTFLKKGDILIARLGVPLCKACIFPLEGKYVTAVDVAIFRTDRSDISKKYLVHLLNSPWFKGQVKLYESGTTRKRISRKNLNNIEIPLPSFDEQRRIVSRIEELFSSLDNAVETLQKTKEQLAVYRQAVLKEAFSHCVDSIVMGSVAEMIDPQPSHRTPPEFENGVPYIGIGDIDYTGKTIRFKEARKVNPVVYEEHLRRYTLHEGDFVMGKIGTIGKPFRLPLPQNYTLSANVILIQPDARKINPEYLFWQFSSPLITEQLMEGKNETSQPAFGIQKARLLRIESCSLEEQKKIVYEIREKVSVCENIEQTVNAALTQAEAMRQSILKEAFEGKLS